MRRLSEIPATRNSYAAGHFELRIDGHPTTAFIRSVEGGHTLGNICKGQSSSDSDTVQQITTVDIEPITFEIGVLSAKSMLQWIKGSWNKQWSRRDGQITHANFDLISTYEQQFYRALITETTFPDLDGASKEAGYLKCQIQPEEVASQMIPGGGPRLSTTLGNSPRATMWTPSAFCLRIDGIDNMQYTNKISSFTIKQNVNKLYAGARRFPEVEPTKLEFPKLQGTISLAYAKGLLDWHDAYITKGTKDGRSERTGAIEFLAPDRKQVLFSIKLSGVNISYATVQPSIANQDQIKRVKFELHVSRMAIEGLGGLGFA